MWLHEDLYSFIIFKARFPLSLLHPMRTTCMVLGVHLLGLLADPETWSEQCHRLLYELLFFIIFPGWHSGTSADSGLSIRLNTVLWQGMKRQCSLLFRLGPGQQVHQGPVYITWEEFSSRSGVWYQCNHGGKAHASKKSLLFHCLACPPVSNNSYKDKRNKSRFIWTSVLKGDNSLLPSWCPEFLS